MIYGKYSNISFSEDGNFVLKQISAPVEKIEERLDSTIRYYIHLKAFGNSVPETEFIRLENSFIIKARRVIPQSSFLHKKPIDALDQIVFGNAIEQDKIMKDSLAELLLIVNNSDGTIGYDASPENFIYGTIDNEKEMYMVDLYPPRIKSKEGLVVDYTEIPITKEKDLRLRESFYSPFGVIKHFSLWFMASRYIFHINDLPLKRSIDLILENNTYQNEKLKEYFSTEQFTNDLKIRIEKARLRFHERLY
jgi:hypothetical protein